MDNDQKDNGLEHLFQEPAPETPPEAEPTLEDILAEMGSENAPGGELDLENILAELKEDAPAAADIPAPQEAAPGRSEADDFMDLEQIIQETMSAQWDEEISEDDHLPPPDPSFFQDDAYSDETGEDGYTDEEEEPEEILSRDGTPRKVRPKRKGGYGLFGLPHLLSTVIWAGLALLIGISLGRLVWLSAADILAFGRSDREVSITITAEDTLDTITEKLHENGLINYPELFKLYAKLAKVREKGKISVGTFTLNTLYDYHALVGGMSATSSFRETTKVVIPEGYTCAQIFALLEERGVCSAKAMEDYAMQSEFSSYWFLEDVPKGTKYCLEGFLYPDTYEFYTNDTPQRVYSKMLARFDDKFNDEMREQLEALNETLALMYKRNGYGQDYIDQHKITVREVVIIASIIEKETAHTGEIRNISSVIYNRLTNPRDYPHLNLDATIVYALGKTELTKEDLQVDHPYNTYIYEGLPPGAISNPGEFCLKGALAPAETDYYFYALDPTAEIRQHRFFRTYQEHQAFLESLGY